MADQGSEGLLSPFLRNRRFAAAIPYLKGRVLDYGCGAGGLAAFVSPELYLGYDVDAETVRLAKALHPDHCFISAPPKEKPFFDAVVSLAVIEHVSVPSVFLSTLAHFLRDDADSRVVLTTPHPCVRSIHDTGARIGLFSKHASEEHHVLLDRNDLVRAGEKAGIPMIVYKRFLFGANQVAVFERRKTT